MTEQTLQLKRNLTILNLLPEVKVLLRQADVLGLISPGFNDNEYDDYATPIASWLRRLTSVPTVDAVSSAVMYLNGPMLELANIRTSAQVQRNRAHQLRNLATALRTLVIYEIGDVHFRYPMLGAITHRVKNVELRLATDNSTRHMQPGDKFMGHERGRTVLLRVRSRRAFHSAGDAYDLSLIHI